MSHLAHAALLFLGALAMAACSQQPPNSEPEPSMTAPVRSLTSVDYERAESYLRPNTDKLLPGRVISQFWQADDTLIYRRATMQGSEYILANPNEGSKVEVIDISRLAPLLERYYSGVQWDEANLSLSAIKLNAVQQLLEFSFSGKNFLLDLQAYQLSELADSAANEYLSPDGSKAAFIDTYNLWVRDTSSNSLSQLTFDGAPDYGYATNNAGWLRDKGPVLKWSPDSSKVATFRHDARDVREMAVYNTKVGHVDVDVWKYPLPGDDSIFMIERVVVHLGIEPKLVKLNMPPDPHRSTTSDHIAGRGGVFLDVQWSGDSQDLAFVSSSRDHKVAQLRIADSETGEVRDVFTEESATYFESGFSDANWRVLPSDNSFIWFSEKDNWGHLYLHDLSNGELKLKLTDGSWRVLDVVNLDHDQRQVYFTGSNLEAGDPYYQYLYRIGFDGSNLVNLTPESANHSTDWSESKRYFVDSYSTPIDAGAVVVRDISGIVVMELETPDMSPLLDSGWVPPEQIVVKARDQLTDIYGLLYKPSNFDPRRQYPILNYLYPGPQSGSVGTRSFVSARGDKQAIAELGFIVVEVDAMGTPGRSKEFHDAYYGNMGDNGLPDQIAAIRQLANDRSYMDIDNVGIWGHSGGGYASTAGILRYPDFFKVAVSGAGNHDNRNYEDDWGEKWQGLLEVFPETERSDDESDSQSVRTNYDNQANQLLAENLEGKLLLAHGMMDTNVHPSNTLLVVDALIDAEKDFDLLVLPNSGHGFGNRRYFMKKRWDYFVRHLAKMEPIKHRFADNIR
ncbi:MAG: dipeptidyl aminopeptidase/acylaminoacyl peptidase [Pseudohongiellaceae bacterium]|jgi:dipeptidyl aminopeptidase/acylaminoacyl peptidase